MHSIRFAPLAGSARRRVHASSLGSHRHRSKRHRIAVAILLAAVFCAIAILSGCGSIAANVSTLGNLVASANSLAFGNVNVGQTASASISLKNESANPVQITQIGVAGQSFTLTSQATLPLTLAGAGTLNLNVQFSPSAAGTAAGTMTLATNASNGNMTFPLTGTGVATVTNPPAQPNISAVSCGNATMVGAGTDSCTVTLSAPAASSGDTVSLSSNDSAVAVPATVIVAANASSATFAATATAVTAVQSATITASLGSSSATFNVQLDPTQSGGVTPAMTLSASNLSFGDVTVNTQATPQFVTVTSSGTAPLTISAATAAGAGFALAGPGFPVTLNPGDAVTLQVNFDPAAAGALTGSLTITTNAPAGGTAVIV